jgi:hypothetical protein
MSLLRKLCIVSLALSALASSCLVEAQEAFVGSWVLDPAASKGVPQLTPTAGTLTVSAAGGGKYTSVSEATVGGVTGRSEITYSVDGKDYVVTATPAQPGAPSIMQSIERVSDTVYKSSLKLGGQEIATALNELSSDGKTWTLMTTGIGQFAMLSSTMVYRRK